MMVPAKWLSTQRRVGAERLAVKLLAKVCLAIACLGICGTAAAHTVRPAVVTVNVERDGGVNVRIRVSAELLLAGIGPEYTDTNDAPNAGIYDALRALPADALAARFEEFAPEFIGRIGLRADGEPVHMEYVGIDVPPPGDLALARDSEIRLRGQLADLSAGLTWLWPRDFGSHVVRFVGPDPAGIVSAWLQPGEISEPWRPQASEIRSRWGIVADYVVVGFEHILPKGLDHILFVVGLFLLSLHLRPLLWQVSAFTLAHTITLGLSVYGVVALPPSVVEPLIALSIAYVGVENCIYDRLHAWRVFLVFGFGLLHGLGFAGVLKEIGLPDGEFFTALISFNVGVELGQLAVILGALLLVGWLRNSPLYRRLIVIPVSAAIALVGLYWAWERAFA